MKAKLLAFEGVEVEKLAGLAARRIRFVGSGDSKIFCLPTLLPRPAHLEAPRELFHDARGRNAQGLSAMSGLSPGLGCHVLSEEDHDVEPSHCAQLAEATSDLEE